MTQNSDLSKFSAVIPLLLVIQQILTPQALGFVAKFPSHQVWLIRLVTLGYLSDRPISGPCQLPSRIHGKKGFWDESWTLSHPHYKDGKMNATNLWVLKKWHVGKNDMTMKSQCHKGLIYHIQQWRNEVLVDLFTFAVPHSSSMNVSKKKVVNGLPWIMLSHSPIIHSTCNTKILHQFTLNLFLTSVIPHIFSTPYTWCMGILWDVLINASV